MPSGSASVADRTTLRTAMPTTPPSGIVLGSRRELRGDGDGEQQVVEVVRDSAGETAHGLPLLRLPELDLLISQRQVRLLALLERSCEDPRLPRDVPEQAAHVHG